jgi:hypothetical protein
MDVRRREYSRSFLAITILLFVTTGCGGNTSSTTEAPSAPQAETTSSQPSAPEATSEIQGQPTQPPAPVEQKIYRIGDVVPAGEAEFVVLGWEIVPGKSFSSPEEGNKYVALELLFANNSNSSIRVSTLSQISMKDGTGKTYETDFDVLVVLLAESIDGELAPGEKGRGWAGFQVPENAQGLQFVFDANKFGAGELLVDLGEEPTTADVPAIGAAQPSPQTHAVGEAVSIGTGTITVNEISYPADQQLGNETKYLAVDVTIENNGSEPLSIRTIDQFTLKDSSDQTHNIDLTSLITTGHLSLDGELAPGEKVNGQVNFRVPETATGLVLVFDGFLWGAGGRVFIALP